MRMTRQPHLSCRPLKQSDAKPMLELGHIFGGQPVQYAELTGGRGERASLRGGHEGPEFIDDIHGKSLSTFCG